MSTFTTTKQLEQVARGADVGVWDTPENSNWGIVDAALGQIATGSLNNTPVVLNAAQFQCCQINFNSTLTGNVSITFPTSFTGPYVIQNNCTGSSAFVVTLQTTAAGGQIVGCPFGEIFDVYNDGTNIKFRNFGRIGTYWDYAGSSVPAWVTACSVPPYLNCDATAFSSATYPTLAAILGTTTLPDARGNFRATLNQGTTRISTNANTANPDGNTRFTTGGAQSIVLSSQNLPNVQFPVTDPGHLHAGAFGSAGAALNPGVTGFIVFNGANTNTLPAVTGITVGSGGSGASFTGLPPVYIGGITMIRAG